METRKRRIMGNAVKTKNKFRHQRREQIAAKAGAEVSAARRYADVFFHLKIILIFYTKLIMIVIMTS